MIEVDRVRYVSLKTWLLHLFLSPSSPLSTALKFMHGDPSRSALYLSLAPPLSLSYRQRGARREWKRDNDTNFQRYHTVVETKAEKVQPTLQ